ncbi:MAG TPA: mammalian cell entry protein, partial [Mycobacterium sp.]|nr:mammalian cell entry protein [Mycobacterium sp.]
DFTLNLNDPPACTVGFLPPSSWRSPDDESDIDTPDGLYCKLPQDSPIAVRGARNYPCMGHPGKRAPTVEICDSDKPYEPIAMRQHALGPGPLDPNLLSQGFRPDDRSINDDHIFAPVQGTPPPLGTPPAAGLPPAPGLSSKPPGPLPQGPAAGPMPAPADIPSFAPLDVPPDAGLGMPHVAPSSFSINVSRPSPSVAVTEYDPGSGQYVAANGQLYSQSNLATTGAVRTWQDLLINQH